VSSEQVRAAIDAGDVEALRNLLRDGPSLVTAVVDAPEIEPTSPLTYVGMAASTCSGAYGEAADGIRTQDLLHGKQLLPRLGASELPAISRVRGYRRARQRSTDCVQLLV
jgi:hypothetical protein